MLEDGTYEIGLEEFKFILSLPTLTDSYFTVFKPSDRGGRRVNLNSSLTSVSDLVAEMNRVMHTGRGKVFATSINITFDTRLFRVKVHTALNYGVVLPRELSRVLGYTDQISFRGANEVTGDTAPDLYRGTYNLFIYTDVGEPISVGNKMESLLGIVSIPKGERSTPKAVTSTFTNPMYVRTMNSRISSIRLYIKDDTSAEVHFRIAPVIARLSVRKRE